MSPQLRTYTKDLNEKYLLRSLSKSLDSRRFSTSSTTYRLCDGRVRTFEDLNVHIPESPLLLGNLLHESLGGIKQKQFTVLETTINTISFYRLRRPTRQSPSCSGHGSNIETVSVEIQKQGQTIYSCNLFYQRFPGRSNILVLILQTIH